MIFKSRRDECHNNITVIRQIVRRVLERVDPAGYVTSSATREDRRGAIRVTRIP